MNPTRYLIGLDLGTSAIKGVLTDERGSVLAEAGAPTRLNHPHEGWDEVEPEPHYRHVCAVLRELAGAAPGEVDAVAMAAASGNTLLTDAEGAPLTNVINWMDLRAEQQPPTALAGLTVNEVRAVTGWSCVGTFPLAQLAWLRENQPALYRAAGGYGMDTDWLLRRLTGRRVMDLSTAATFHLVDQISGAYHMPFLQRLEIPLDKLPVLVDSGVVVGPMTPQGALDTGLSSRTRVVTGCFDHPAAARAVGVTTPGQLMLSCGTSWVGFVPWPDRRAILDAGLLCDPFLSRQGGPWGGIFSVTGIGRRVDWYIENVIAPGESDRYRVFNESAAEAGPGAGGMRIDLSESPRRIEGDRRTISRAVMEGAARLLNDLLQGLKKRGFRYDHAVMVGGPANSPVWPGIVEEITGIRITTGGRSAGARGAALLAAGARCDAMPVDGGHKR